MHLALEDVVREFAGVALDAVAMLHTQHKVLSVQDFQILLASFPVPSPVWQQPPRLPLRIAPHLGL